MKFIQLERRTNDALMPLSSSSSLLSSGRSVVGTQLISNVRFEFHQLRFELEGERERGSCAINCESPRCGFIAFLRFVAMETCPIRSTDPIKSHSLAELEKQLLLYKTPLCPLDSEGEESEVDDRGAVFSPMAVADSVVAPTSLSRSARFRFKTAAVLICLFEDSNGDLRVILTKRSSNLNTSPGKIQKKKA